MQRALTPLLSHTCPTNSPEVTESVSCSLSYPRSRRGAGSSPEGLSGQDQCPAVPHSWPLQQPSEPPCHHVPTPRSSPPRRSHQTGLKVNNSLPQPEAGSGREHPSWGARGGRGPQAAEPGKRHGAAEGDSGGTYDQGWATNTSSFHTPELFHSLIPFPRCPPAPAVLRAGCPPVRAVTPGVVCRAPGCSCHGRGVACHSRHLAPRRSKPGRRIKDKTLQVFSRARIPRPCKQHPNPAPARGAFPRKRCGGADPPIEMDMAIWDGGEELPPRWGGGITHSQQGRSHPCLSVTGACQAGTARHVRAESCGSCLPRTPADRLLPCSRSRRGHREGLGCPGRSRMLAGAPGWRCLEKAPV